MPNQVERGIQRRDDDDGLIASLSLPIRNDEGAELGGNQG